MQGNEPILKAFQIIGEKEAYNESLEMFQSTKIASPYCLLAEIHSEHIEKILGDSLYRIIQAVKKIKILQKVYLFSVLSVPKLRRLVEHLQPEIYEAKEFIIRQGEMGSKFYIIAEGSVDIVIDNVSLKTS